VPCTTVCVSSENGAAGTVAAGLAAESLGLRLIDEDIVTNAALEAGVDREAVVEVEQRRSKVQRLLETYGTAGMEAGGAYLVADAALYTQPASDDLRGLIRSVIEETADAGGVMIVSHAASHALAGRDGVLRVLFTTSPDTRRARMAERLQLSEDDAGRELKRSDAARADYLKRFYGVDSEHPRQYDLVINTDRIAPQDAAKLIVAAAGLAG
jgi:hypothetical protein